MASITTLKKNEKFAQFWGGGVFVNLTLLFNFLLFDLKFMIIYKPIGFFIE